MRGLGQEEIKSLFKAWTEGESVTLDGKEKVRHREKKQNMREK